MIPSGKNLGTLKDYIRLDKDRERNKSPILLGLDWQIQTMSVGLASPTRASFGKVISSAILSNLVIAVVRQAHHERK